MRKIHLIIGCLVIACLFFTQLTVYAQAKDAEAVFSVKDAVTEAISRNPNIKAAAERIAAAGEGVKRARTELFFKTSLNSSYTQLGETPVMKTAGGEVQSAHKKQFHHDITLVQPVFTGFALTTNLDMAKLDVETGELERKQAILDLARDMKTSCYNYLLAQKMLMVADSEVETLESHKREAEQFYKQGLIPENDLLRSEVALADAVQNREKARAGVESAMSLLKMLMDSDIDRSIGIDDIAGVPVISFDFSGLAGEAVLQRPLVKTLRKGIEKLGLAETLSKSSCYPNISLVGRYERNGDNFEGTNNDYSNTYNSSVTLQAQWTFFEWGKTGAEIRKNRHEKRALARTIKNVENSIRLEVKNALLNLEVAKENIGTAEKSLNQAQENWRITKLQYGQQIATSSDVLDARTFLSRADSNYFRALYGYMAHLAELDRAVGKI